MRACRCVRAVCTRASVSQYLCVCVCVFCLCLSMVFLCCNYCNRRRGNLGTLSSAYFSCFIDGRLYSYIVRFLLLDETCQPQHFVVIHICACMCLTRWARLPLMIRILSEPKPTRHGLERAAFHILLQIVLLFQILGHRCRILFFIKDPPF